MLTSSGNTSPALPFPTTSSLPRLAQWGAGPSASSSRGQSQKILAPTVNVTPDGVISRRGVEWHGMAAEFVQATSHDRMNLSFRAPQHLLIVYEQGARQGGDTYVEGLPQSTLRNFTKKLTFVPAGHGFRESHDPRTLARATYFYFDSAELEPDFDFDGVTFAPRLFFEDAAILGTAAKLRQALQYSGAKNSLYVEALGVVLVHELIRLNRGAPQAEAPIRGGLAGWQQRVITSYIEEHLADPISLATLAKIVHLSTFYFCRAFKQTFGVPPHRYHIERRIEHAKAMLAERKHSVTEIGLTLGYSATSSFTASFRKITGQTPSGYQRVLR